MNYHIGRGEKVGLKGYFHSNQWLFLIMLISSTICLIASFILSVEAITLAEDPTATLACDLNEVFSCGTVAVSWQASVFGFPNAFIGLICEPVVMTIAVAGLSNLKLPRWFMFTAQCVYLLGLIFALWLFTQSAFVIYALCPYCLLITIFTSVTFFTMLHYNIRENNLYLPTSAQRVAESLARLRVTEIAGGFVVGLVLVLIGALYGPTLFS